VNYAVEMGSGAMIYIPSFIKIGSGIQELIGGGKGVHIYVDTQATWKSHTTTFFFFNKESRLEIEPNYKL
jgi:hypothetical protein